MSDAHESFDAERTGANAPGQVIGRYKLLEVLGEGGMGTVWMAQQSAPVKRRVALKIIKLGMDTREVVARFEVERQALALMDHPHIAKVLDGGATEAGRPYFVMELVRGLPITEFCDQSKLGLRERLEIFSKVCHAIQHAHHKGIIHRDVKPSNILVSLQDGEPQPKVIDFGIAKATNAELTQKTLYTQLSQIIGTPEYMAPEQAESGGLDIDTRADVYSLGVLLYELLTGTKPFDLKQAILTDGFEEMLRVIREVDPAKPSTRISSLGESGSSIASMRRVDTQVLNKRLRGDLDWIVMKALEKDRARRYGTANALAQDIANYLNDEAVDAAPPSARYRLMKLLRRRKKTVISMATIALLLIAGSVGTGIGWWKASQANKSLDQALDQKAVLLEQEEQQRRLAEESEKRASIAKAQALAEAKRATAAEADTRARADELEQVAEFQAEQLAGLDVSLMGVRMHAAMLQATPEERRAGLDAYLTQLNFTNLALGTLRDNLFERTVDVIDEQFALQPLVRAKLLQTTADTWRDLGLVEIALDPQRRALSIRRKYLGDEHPNSLTSMNNLGFMLRSQGKFSEAEPHFRRVLEARRRALGDEHPDTLTSINNLGGLIHSQGKFAEAEPLLREALSVRRVLGNEHPDTLNSISNLGTLLKTQGKLIEAEPLLREALIGYRRVLGDEHPDTLDSINSLGALLYAQGKFTEAEPLLRAGLEASRRVLGDEHPDTLDSINDLGAVLLTQDKLAEAEPLYREALEVGRRVLGDEHPDTLTSISNMGTLLERQGKGNEAERLLREAISGRRRVLGGDHPRTQRSIDNLGGLLRNRLRSSRDSGSMLQQGEALASLGSFLVEQGQHQEAESLLAEALDLLFAEAPENAAGPWHVQLNLALAIAGQGRFGEAEGILEESSEWMFEHEEALAELKGLGSPRTKGEVLQSNVAVHATWHAAEPGKGHDTTAASWQTKLDAWNAEHNPKESK